MIGTSFQPGSDDPQQRMARRPSGSNEGVQEAIKVLSLRLPKVVGAQAVSPQALLTAQGGRGNPQIDSIVESVLSQMFPSAASSQQSPVASLAPSMAPQVEQMRQAFHTPFHGGGSPEPSRAAPAPQGPIPNLLTFPRITVGLPPTPPPGPDLPFGNPRLGTDADLSGGGQSPGALAPAPNLQHYFDWLPSPTPEQYLI